MTRRHIPTRQLAAIFDRKPESLAGRMVRELAAEAGGFWPFILLCAGAATLGFILGGGLFR